MAGDIALLARARKAKRHEHRWMFEVGVGDLCTGCGILFADYQARQRRGRNNRSRGNSYELQASRIYGGEKVGPLGLPEDIRGLVWKTQVKSHTGDPPAAWSVTTEWRAVFSQLGDAFDGHRWPRLLLTYLPGIGRKRRDYFVVPRRVADLYWGGLWQIRHGWLVEDYFVVRGSDWLDWFGKDE